ncbi:MAG: HAMP domain-containing histidine kinase [Candidatus Saccharibacteria bacterium]|nr:HAMP domain-containing histidine kinase [Candidatus Saccharibacteria bacterium]
MKFLSKQFFIVVMVLLIVAASASTWYAVTQSGRQLKDSLLGRVSSMSAFVDPSLIQALKGDETDLERPEYAELKKSLKSAVRLNADVRFVYLMAKDQDGVYFLADSTDPTSEDYSAPGDRYPEASPELIASFDRADEFIEGPASDSFGTWLSGLSPVYNAEGTVIAMLGMDIDYSVYEAQVTRAALVPIGIFLFLISLDFFGVYVRRQEQDAANLKAELVSIASHDLRSPLTGIEWAAKAIAENPQDENNAREMGIAVATTTTELRNTVNTILQMAVEGRGIDTGIHKEILSLKQLLTESADVFRLPAQSHKTKIILSTSVTDEISVFVDKEKFKRALSNLINNAVKYTRPDTEISIEYELKDNQHVIGIRDQGVGIPVADQEKVMAGYHRAANVARSGIEGTGLGIILTRKIIEAHGGTLTFESTENVGTCFYIHLPASEQA